MPFEPQKITKEHVLQGIKKIEEGNIQLIAPTRYYVDINGKKYPPKEVMRYAHEQMNGEHSWYRNGGNPTNSFLEKMGFKIIGKDIDPVKDLIEKYKSHLRTNGLDDELYKWKLITEYNGRPNLNATDIHKEFKSINYANLTYHLGVAVARRIAEFRPEPFRTCFRALFDESTPLVNRIKTYDEVSLKLYSEFMTKEKFGHYQDERTMATFLTFHNPDKYTFYKSSFYQEYCKLLGISSKGKGEKYVHYLELIEDLVTEYINEDQELLDLVYGLIPKDYFQDPNYKLLAQDILYQTLEKLAEANKVIALMAADGTGWQDGHILESEGYDSSVLWNSKRPSGTDETLNFLREKIESGQTFNLYYCVGGFVNYKATIIDFAESQEELDLKAWDKNYSKILHYESSFDNYKDQKKNATIVFLVKSLEKINPIPVSQFKFYKNFEEPRQDNLSPIIFEPENKQESINKTVNIMTEDNFPLNQILFGPPGTGKTFKLQNEYFDKFTLNETSITREQYLENIISELSWWQVISVAVLDLGSAKVNEIYEHEFVKIKEKLSSSKTIRPTIWGQLQSHTVMDCPHVNVSRRAEPLFFSKSADSQWSLDKELLDQYYPEAIQLLASSKKYVPDNKKSVKNYDFITFHQSFSYEDFIEGIKPKLDDGDEVSYEIKDGIFKRICLKAEADPKNSYAIFIDEINRGNVSAIFGELITLIEKDKRLGEENELRVKLPYSKSEFGVPSNLHIIGTMNTADRSIEALDTALRRRFSFEEMKPIPSLLKNKGLSGTVNGMVEGIDLVLLLNIINIRIEKLIDKDHCIGHSYFLKVSDMASLKNAFKNEIIPLLQEYFFGDYGKIGLVLGEAFFEMPEANSNSGLFGKFFDYDGDEFAERTIYKLKNVSKMSDDDFVSAINALLKK